jgi:hypothetical protein
VRLLITFEYVLYSLKRVTGVTLRLSAYTGRNTRQAYLAKAWQLVARGNEVYAGPPTWGTFAGWMAVFAKADYILCVEKFADIYARAYEVMH